MKNRIFSLLTVILLVFLNVSCDCDDDDNNNHHSAPNLVRLLTVTNGYNQTDQNVVAGKTAHNWNIIALDTNGATEDIVVNAITIEDLHTGTGNFTEIGNLEIWADLTADNSPRGDIFEVKVSNTKQPNGFNNTLTFNLTEPLIIPPNSVVVIATLGSLLLTADYITPGTHQLSAIDVVAHGKRSGIALDLIDSSLVIQDTGKIMTTVEKGNLIVSVDVSSPPETILIDSSLKQTVAVFKLEADENEAIGLTDLKLTDLGTGKAALTCYLYSSIRNDGLPVTEPIATVAMAPFNPATCQFSLASAINIPADSSVLLTLKVDLYSIDGANLYNGDALQLAISDPTADITATGLDSGKIINGDAGQEKANQMLIFEAKPIFSVHPSSPSGLRVPGFYVQLAYFNISNISTIGNDISFQNSAGNYLTVEVSSNCSGAGTSGNLVMTNVDGSVIYSTISNVNLCQAGSYTFTFNNNDLWISAGTTKTIQIRGDTVGFTNPDALLLWFDDNIGGASKIGWSINANGQNYGLGKIIFANDIFGGALTF